MNKYLDLLERAVKTGVQVALALLVTSNFFESVDRLGVARGAAIAGMSAGLSVVTSGLSMLWGDRDSASALPAKTDPN